MLPRPALTRLAVLAIVSLLTIGLSTAFSARPIRLSDWRGQGPAAVFSRIVGAQATPLAGAPASEAATSGLKVNDITSQDQAGGEAALERYNQGSVLQEAAADGRVRYYRRDLPGGGMVAYFVVLLDERVHVEVINADGATPGSDKTGDTIWTDGQQHLTTVEAMVAAPYAARPDMTLLGAMAFGFHGDVRTSDEGTVVIDGRLYHLNAGRAALCITKDRRAQIGLFDANQVRQCEQAIGGGPVILLGGKIANPDVAAPMGAFVPYNPLHEDFAQIEWRRAVYTGTQPKSVIGVGARANGGSYLVMLVSYGVRGVELAEQLKALGCSDALGGDDDSSTQAVWRGAPVYPRPVGEVPDAVAVYVRH